jgi:hypothetical protein
MEANEHRPTWLTNQTDGHLMHALEGASGRRVLRLFGEPPAVKGATRESGVAAEAHTCQILR